jgi:uncharacterized membrane-anchored protein
MILGTWSVHAAEGGSGPKHLNFIKGTVTVGDHLATIAIPEECRYLAADDARYWVETIWHNPPDHEVIGMVVPQDVATWYADLENGKHGEDPVQSWGMVVSWGGETGHVEDDDARSTDYPALLKEMQNSIKEANPERMRTGYGSLELIGWAEPPHYDSSSKKLYWAKSLRFNNNQNLTLNYCVRVLGARGVLELNTVDDVNALPQVAEISKTILTSTEFTAGNRYADYKSGIDPVAAGGIAALIGGGLIAKKIGFFALAGVFVLKFFKILLIPILVVGGWLLKRVRGS